jgi:hypothetical protein
MYIIRHSSALLDHRICFKTFVNICKFLVQVLSEKGFPRGTSVLKYLQSKDVGSIIGVILSTTTSDHWMPEKVIVKRSGREEVKFEARGQILRCPQKCAIALSLPKAPADGGKKPSGSSNKSPSSGETSSSGGEKRSKNKFKQNFLFYFYKKYIHFEKIRMTKKKIYLMITLAAA